MKPTTDQVHGAGAASPDELATAVVEHVMRCGADLDLAAEIADAAPCSAHATTLLGRFMASHPGVALVTGSPLAVWAAGGTLDPQWRAAYPPSPHSAYAHLSFLDELYPCATPATGDLDRLLDLQARSVSELAAA